MRKYTVVFVLFASCAFAQERVHTARECGSDLSCLERAQNRLTELRGEIRAARNRQSAEAWNTVHKAEHMLGLPESREPQSVGRSLPQGGTEIYRTMFNKTP